MGPWDDTVMSDNEYPNVWTSGGTDCLAPTGNYYTDRYLWAVKKIKSQPFFDPAAFKLNKIARILSDKKISDVHF